MTPTFTRVVREVATLAATRDWVFFRSYFTFWASDEELAAKVLAWCRFFLPQYFRDQSPAFHADLICRLFSPKNEYTAAPRGFAKTTLIQGVLAYIAAHKLRSFIVLVEKTYREAAEVLAGVRAEFADNPMLLEVYGDLVAKNEHNQEPDKVKDAEGDMLIHGVRFRAKGFNTPIRGLKSSQHRPDLIVLDDVEEDEHVRNDDQRRKYMENFTQGIIPALDIAGSVKVFGTILHRDSLLQNLINQHNGKVYAAYDIHDPENTLLWPDRWSFSRLEEKRRQMEMEGLGSSKFSQEFLNQPLDDDSRRFHWEWLQKRFKDSDVDSKLVNRFACFDVADAKGDGRDWTFLTVLDWDVENNWYVRHAKQRQVDSLELIDWIFSVWQYWKPNKIGVEKNAFEFQIRPLLKQRSAESSIFPVCEELKDGGRNKEARIIGALQGRCQLGKVFFLADPKDDTNILISQLYDFPKAKHDDGADSLAYHADLGSRPFSAQGRDDLLPPEHREFFEHKKQSLKQSRLRSLLKL